MPVEREVVGVGLVARTDHHPHQRIPRDYGGVVGGVAARLSKPCYLTRVDGPTIQRMSHRHHRSPATSGDPGRGA